MSRYNTDNEDNFTQVGIFYQQVLTPEERQRLVENIAGHLKNSAPFIQKRAVSNFKQAHIEYGSKIEELLAHPKTSSSL